MNVKYLIDRFISTIYDYIFIVLLIGITSLILYMLSIKKWLIILFVFFLYFVLYPMLCFVLKGSLGKVINDLYVEPTYGRLTYGRFLFREVLMKQLFYLTIIGLIVEIVFFIIKKELIHDYYLKTIVKKKSYK